MHVFWNTPGTFCSEYSGQPYFHQFCKIKSRHLVNENSSTKTVKTMWKTGTSYASDINALSICQSVILLRYAFEMTSEVAESLVLVDRRQPPRATCRWHSDAKTGRKINKQTCWFLINKKHPNWSRRFKDVTNHEVRLRFYANMEESTRVRPEKLISRHCGHSSLIYRLICARLWCVKLLILCYCLFIFYLSLFI